MKRLLLLSLLLGISNLLNAQGWGQTQKMVPDDRDTAARFGFAVAMDGDYAVIGASLHDNPNIAEGSAFIYQHDGNGNWTQLQKLSAPDAFTNDFFGYAVDIDDETIIVSARNQDFGGPSSTNTNTLEAAGAAYIFEKNISGTWDFVFKAVAPDRAEFDLMGEAVAVSGDYAVVTAQAEEEDENGLNTLIGAGSAYIYERDNNGNWSFVQKIVTSDRALDDRLGRDGSVSMDGNTIVISAEAEDEDENGLNTLNYAGSVYVFERDGNGIWNETQKIVPSNRAFADAFGSDLAISGDFMVVGAQLRDFSNEDSGVAYVFKKVGGVWQELQQLTPSNPGLRYRFGRTVDIHGNRLVIGAYQEEIFDNKSFAGAAYVYENDGSDVWNLEARIAALDADASDNFSYGIAISGDFVISGAYRDGEDENGENSLSSAGSAYVFDVNEPNTIPTLSSIENKFNTTVKAYPNPTKNSLNLDLGAFLANITISVYNVIGQQVFSENYSNAKTIQLGLNQPNGVYLVEVKVNTKTLSVIKVIKH